MTQTSIQTSEFANLGDPSNDNDMASSQKTGRGYLTGPGLYEFPVDYVVVDGLAIHAGCIELGTVEEVEAEAQRQR